MSMIDQQHESNKHKRNARQWWRKESVKADLVYPGFINWTESWSLAKQDAVSWYLLKRYLWGKIFWCRRQLSSSWGNNNVCLKGKFFAIIMIDHLARSATDLLSIVHQLERKSVQLRVVAILFFILAIKFLSEAFCEGFLWQCRFSAYRPR